MTDDSVIPPRVPSILQKDANRRKVLFEKQMEAKREELESIRDQQEAIRQQLEQDDDNPDLQAKHDRILSEEDDLLKEIYDDREVCMYACMYFKECILSLTLFLRR